MKEICEYCEGIGLINAKGDTCPKCNAFGYIITSEETPRTMAHNKPHGSYPKDKRFN